MAIDVNWGSAEHKVIHLEFKPGWTWEDLYGAIKQADEMIISVDHTVHLIIDIRKAGALPGDFMTVARDVFAKGSARANEGYRIVVGAGRLIQIAYRGFLGVYGHKLEGRPFIFASNLDEAHAILEQKV